jgi:hypothetical protein
MRAKSFLLFFSLLLNIVVFFLYAKRHFFADDPPSDYYYYDSLNTARVDFYSNFPIDSTDIVFVGSSLTEGFPVSEIFGSHVKNRGIGGNETTRILGRIGDIARSHPKAILLESGINDIRNNYSLSSIIDFFEQITDTIKKVSASTQLVIQSCPPVIDIRYANKIDSLNTLLKEFCSNQKIMFLDIHSVIDSTCLNPDGIHINGKGYRKWAEYLRLFHTHSPYSFSISLSKTSSSKDFK